jgi:catechol 2,3 dioxygenase
MTAAPEPIRDVAHIGHVELLTPKPEASLHYFTDLLGMEAVHREGQSVWLRAYGDYAAATLKLTEAAAAGIGHLAWRAVSPQALDRRVAAIEVSGLGVGWTNGDFGHGATFRFRDPDGHAMEIYFDEERYVPPPELRSTLNNLPMKYPAHGIGVRRTDHVALLCQDVAANREFMERTLGLSLREQVLYENGTREIGSWMSPSPVHHEVAYVLDTAGAHGRLHHFSLWTDNRDDVLRAADIFRENDVFIEAGPSKHNNSQAFYIYSYEPGGNRVEIYTGSFLVFAPDFEPVIWDETARGTGVYWGAALPDSFMHYATPDVARKGDSGIPVIDPR